MNVRKSVLEIARPLTQFDSDRLRSYRADTVYPDVFDATTQDWTLLS